MKARVEFVLVMLLGVWPLQLLAQAPEGIYTCTDAKGRKLTSDRLIPECVDREQRVHLHEGDKERTVTHEARRLDGFTGCDVLDFSHLFQRSIKDIDVVARRRLGAPDGINSRRNAEIPVVLIHGELVEDPA